MSCVLKPGRKTIDILFRPYQPHFAHDGWCVIGYSGLHKRNRSFKLSRIQDVRTEGRTVLPDKPFKIEKFLGSAWSIMPAKKSYQAKLFLNPMVAASIAGVRWHHTQKLTWQPNGSWIFEVQIDGLQEISWWVLSYADQIEVLTP